MPFNLFIDDFSVALSGKLIFCEFVVVVGATVVVALTGFFFMCVFFLRNYQKIVFESKLMMVWFFLNFFCFQSCVEKSKNKFCKKKK